MQVSSDDKMPVSSIDITFYLKWVKSIDIKKLILQPVRPVWEVTFLYEARSQVDTRISDKRVLFEGLRVHMSQNVER